MNINGENHCFVCGQEIRWQAHITKPGNTEKKVDGSKVQAELFAVGKVNTTEGIKTEYEVIVQCPHCKNKNKFK